ncbi:hypothetical protein [Mucilaginibacter sp.]|uniref:hypothetical protein n=1 Tax=Mucilaginibacter sp. TaxID=1882438 RepID=UPI00261B2326|nr:hypothetical protein [Mucilaginibacter sp.]MDB4925867.1 hypothetical protein [Mucilaginibacter sp.]
MKKHYLILKSILILLLVILTKVASAQVTAGPSTTTPIPTVTADADKFVCSGTSISLSGPGDPAAGGAAYTKYHWYKIIGGSTQEATAQTGINYSEASGAPGYYEYRLVTENANGCLSPMSNMIKVYVLPPINAAVTATFTTLCSGVGSTVLTANVTAPTGYTLNYQWTLGGTPISPAQTGNTLTVSSPTVVVNTTLNYAVNISYALNSSCSVSPSQSILIVPLPGQPAITVN